jgi:Type I phosphodiesterase / nucleotide pyrophosphatase
VSLRLFSSSIDFSHFTTEKYDVPNFNCTSVRASSGRIAALCALVISLVGLWPLPSASAADFVIQISVDGLRPDYMQTVINAGNAPNFKRFQTEGAWTNNARTDYTHTITLPNHTSMLTGRPVSLPAGAPNTTHHGYTDNGDPAPSTTLHNFTNPDYYKASTFDVVHDAGLSTALFASKNKFIIYDQSYNATTGAEHVNGRDKIDKYFGPEDTATMQGQLLADLAANHFNYTFLHYADTDDAGHGSGWGTPAWNNALITIDGYLGQLFNLVESDGMLAGQTAIILSADHGGTGTGHSTATAATNYTIPFFAWGAGVGHGDLYAINSATRVNPGTSRPDYNAIGQPIRNGDGGNLALSLLGLDPIPGSLINAAQNLRVAVPEPASFCLLLVGSLMGLLYWPHAHRPSS